MRRAITARSISSVAPCRIGSLLVDRLPFPKKCTSPRCALAKPSPLHDQFCKIQVSPLSIWSLVSPASSTKNYTNKDDNNNKHSGKDHSQFQPSSSSSSSTSKAPMSMPTRQQQVLRPADCDGEIARLLGCPNDAILDAATWVKADSCVLEAVEQANFHLAFELIDRMAKDPRAPTEMNNEVLFTVVHEWLMAHGRNLKVPVKDRPTTYLHYPISVWMIIER